MRHSCTEIFHQNKPFKTFDECVASQLWHLYTTLKNQKTCAGSKYLLCEAYTWANIFVRARGYIFLYENPLAFLLQKFYGIDCIYIDGDDRNNLWSTKYKLDDMLLYNSNKYVFLFIAVKNHAVMIRLKRIEDTNKFQCMYINPHGYTDSRADPYRQEAVDIFTNFSSKLNAALEFGWEGESCPAVQGNIGWCLAYNIYLTILDTALGGYALGQERRSDLLQTLCRKGGARTVHGNKVSIKNYELTCLSTGAQRFLATEVADPCIIDLAVFLIVLYFVHSEFPKVEETVRKLMRKNSRQNFDVDVDAPGYKLRA